MDADSDGYIRPGPEHNELPGGPRKRLVKEVRGVLWRHLRCRPHRSDATWRMAWEWADACARRAAFWTKQSRKWPSPTEIASQYLLLVLADMRDCRALRLPFHAAECVTPRMQARFGGSPQNITQPQELLCLTSAKSASAVETSPPESPESSPR